MHYLLPTVVWAVSFAGAYSAGRLWVEAKHAGGLHWFAAWILAALTAVGFTSAYFLFLVAGLETFRPELFGPETTSGLWPLWPAFLATPFVALLGTSFLGGWARAYRDEVVARASYPSYQQLNDRYAEVTSVAQAARDVTQDLAARTRKRLRRGRRQTASYSGFRALDSAIVPDGGNMSSARIDLPKIDLPKVDLPKVDLPKIDLGSSNSGGGGDSDGAGALVLVVVIIVAAIVAICLGAITTWIVITRIAGEAEPMPKLASSSP